MTDLDTIRHGRQVNRQTSRQVGRELGRLDGTTTLQVARVEAQADVQAAQVNAVAAVAQRAMQGVAFVSQVEQQLGQAVPLSVTRLQAIGDVAALAMTQVVMRTAETPRTCR